MRGSRGRGHVAIAGSTEPWRCPASWKEHWCRPSFLDRGSCLWPCKRACAMCHGLHNGWSDLALCLAAETQWSSLHGVRAGPASVIGELEDLARTRFLSYPELTRARCSTTGGSGCERHPDRPGAVGRHNRSAYHRAWTQQEQKTEKKGSELGDAPDCAAQATVGGIILSI